MRAFEVFVNGERLCLAGITGRCVLTVIIDHVKGKVDPVDDVHLQVAGLISDTNEHVIWSRIQLNTDDEVRVRIVESESADKPIERLAQDSEEDLEQKRLSNPSGHGPELVLHCKGGRTTCAGKKGRAAPKSDRSPAGSCRL